MSEEHRVAVVGTGAIAHAHLFALNALPSYYANVPLMHRVVVASPRRESREAFAQRYQFDEAIDPRELWPRDDLDTVFLLGPNDTHIAHLQESLQMPGIRRVYLEKPLGIFLSEAEESQTSLEALSRGVTVQMGYQFLQMGAIRRALTLVRSRDWGVPVHFHARYLHSGYLNADYRSQRGWRMEAPPAGGVTSDLGSHLASLLVAFLGPHLEVIAARRSDPFSDVAPGEDLCMLALLRDQASGAVGTLTASRISAGAGDQLELEIRYTDGAFRFSSDRPDVLEVFERDNPSEWITLNCGNDYTPISAFPTKSVPSGWLRSLVHAHYLFFGGDDPHAFVPDLNHGLEVERLLEQMGKQASNGRIQ